MGKCSDADPDTWVPIHTWVIEPRTESEEVDQFYALDWTIDPFTLQPLILVGGVQGVVYVLDCGTLGIRRILRGHGGVSYYCWIDTTGYIADLDRTYLPWRPIRPAFTSLHPAPMTLLSVSGISLGRIPRWKRRGFR